MALAKEGLGVDDKIALCVVRAGGAAGGHAVAAGLVNAIALDAASAVTSTPGGALLHGLYMAVTPEDRGDLAAELYWADFSAEASLSRP